MTVLEELTAPCFIELTMYFQDDSIADRVAEWLLADGIYDNQSIEPYKIGGVALFEPSVDTPSETDRLNVVSVRAYLRHAPDDSDVSGLIRKFGEIAGTCKFSAELYYNCEAERWLGIYNYLNGALVELRVPEDRYPEFNEEDNEYAMDFDQCIKEYGEARAATVIR